MPVVIERKGFQKNEYFGHKLRIFWGPLQNWTIFFFFFFFGGGVISMHFRVFSFGQGTELGVVKI